MVDSIPSVPGSSFDATSYLNFIKGNSTSATGSSGSSSSSNTGNSTGNTQTTQATPPSTTTLGIPSDVLSLIQGIGSGSSDSSLVGTLLDNGLSSSDPLTALLLTDSTTAPLQEAVATSQQQQADATATTSNNPEQNVLTSYLNNLNSYNSTLIQNAKNAVTASQQATQTIA